ncbi:MAG: hypothetical protein WBY47_00975 [Desulfobacterales bacterium]|jgi:hypothetical protein
MSDSEDEKLKAEIDKIMTRINKIIKKIEGNETEKGCDSKHNEE